MVALRNNHPLDEIAGESVKAISLWQPWASAIPLGLKRYETRSWKTSHRGLLAIHASKTTDAHFAKRFASQYPALRGTLPSGAMLCIVELVDCVPTEQIRGGLSAQEREFGDYSDGRFAWELRLVEVFETPIPVTGRQGLFDWVRPTIPTPNPSPNMGRGAKPAVGATENHIVLADELVIPAEAMAGQRVVVVGQSGSGKTNTLTVIAEEWARQGWPFTIIDPMAQFTRLPGATVYGLGDGQTRLLNPHQAALSNVKNGARIVLDMSLYDEDEALDLLDEYLETLWDVTFRLSYPNPNALIIDEAYMYAPQVGKTPIKKRILDAARRGRHKRLTTVIASQRAATIDKNFFTQATMIVSHRLVHTTDTAEIIRQSPMPPKEVITTMYDLNIGQALVAGDKTLIGADYKIVQIRKSAYLRPANRQPYDSFPKNHAMRDWFERNAPTKSEIERWERSIAKFEAEITKLEWEAAELRKKWATDEDEREAIKHEGMALVDEVRRTRDWIAAYRDRVRICREVGI